MGSVLDVFNGDAYTVKSLTDWVNKQPYKPARIDQMGLFQTRGVTTTSVMVEEREGLLALLPTRRRGEAGVIGARPKRKVRSIAIPHIPYPDTIMADDVQNVRAFGSTDQTEAIMSVVNDRLLAMRGDHAATLEYHRIGALQGVILDADGADVVCDLHAEFGTTPTSIDFDLGSSTTKVRNKCVEVIRAMETALGASPYTYIHAFCGATWFDKFIEHDAVKKAYELYQQGELLRTDVRTGFKFGNIIFEEYRGSVSGVTFFPAAEARFFPVGVPGLFVTYFAPANYVETVNTIGLPIYAKQRMMDFDKGIQMETQSNPLNLCLRPTSLIRGTTSS